MTKYTLVSVFSLWAIGASCAFATTVGFSQVGSESGWRTSFSEAVKAEAKQRGIDLKFADAQQKQENQIKAVRSFIAQGVDAIIIAPVVETGWKPVLKEAKRANIPVVIVDRNIKVDDDSLFLTRIASDFTEEGRKIAQWLMDKTQGNCAIAELQAQSVRLPLSIALQVLMPSLLITRMPTLCVVKLGNLPALRVKK